ncbi:MAG: histone deacetylase [Myxococcota bacterium]
MWFLSAPANPEPRDGTVLPGGVVVAWSPAYRVSFFGIERLHPFDIAKLDSIAGSLMDEGLLTEADFWIPEAIGDDALAAVHDPAYLASLHQTPVLSQALEVPVPDVFPESVVERRVRHAFRKAVGGTVLAMRGALKHGVGINVGGGFHHARPALGHGFCIYNDVAYALHVARAEGFSGRVLIVDTDAHQGDGNHSAFADDPSVTAFSLHGGHLFPEPKVPGDADYELPPHIRDAEYLAVLDRALGAALTEPVDLIVHVAGSDVLADDPLADLGMTPDGLVERDLRVFRAARSRGIPVLHLLAGGYGPSSARAQSASLAALLREAR